MRLNRYEVSQALNTLNWQNIFDKYQHRDLTLSVESFIEKEVTPKLGFTVSVSTFTKRLCNIRKRANSNVSVIDLETTTHAVRNLQIFTPLKKPSLDPTIMPCLSKAQAGTLREQVS